MSESPLPLLRNLSAHQQNDDPSSVAYRMLQQLLYGPESVYARQATRTSVESITRQDVKRQVRDFKCGALG